MCAERTAVGRGVDRAGGPDVLARSGPRQGRRPQLPREPHVCAACARVLDVGDWSGHDGESAARVRACFLGTYPLWWHLTGHQHRKPRGVPCAVCDTTAPGPRYGVGLI